MVRKPDRASGYSSEQARLVVKTCLYVATKLGDLRDELVVVGGIVPTLIIDQERLPPLADPHVGTLDLDVGLSLALLDKSRYAQVSERLRSARFAMDKNELGNPTRQRWVITEPGPVTIDFLIPTKDPEAEGGGLFNLEQDFAAVESAGLELAFRDRVKIMLSGTTIRGERAERDVWVSDAGAYVVMKALAFANRGENKGAYDLYYVTRNYGRGVVDVAGRLRPLLDDLRTRKALAMLERDFASLDSLGPRRVAEFLAGAPDDDLQADVSAFGRSLLDGLSADSNT